MISSKHIVFLFRDLGTGGAQKIQAFVANACLEAGYRVSAISMTNTPATVNLDSRIPVQVLNLYSVSDVKRPMVRRLLDRAFFLLRLRKKIKGLQPDLLVVFLTDVVRIAVLAACGLGLSVLASERADPLRYTIKEKHKYTEAFNQCSEVVFQLEKAKDAFQLRPSVRTSVIPNPCLPRNGKRFKNRETCGDTGKYILSAGRLCKQKRFDVLIRAFGVLNRKFPDYQLLIYGEGDDRNALERLVEAEGLQGKVSLPGDSANPFDNETQPALFALSSDFEGIPNVLIEAMGHGIPCISTDCTPGGAAFLLDHGRRGKLVPVGDWQTLGEEMIGLLENQALRQQFSKKGFEIFELFNPQTITDLWLGAVSRCLGKAQ